MADYLWNAFAVFAVVAIIFGLIVLRYAFQLLWYLFKGSPEKRCKDCKYTPLSCSWPKWAEQSLGIANVANKCKVYHRKWYKFWRPK